MYILIEERVEYDSCKGTNHTQHESIRCSPTLEVLVKYCIENYKLTEHDLLCLSKYNCAEGIFDSDGYQIDLVIEHIEEI